MIQDLLKSLIGPILDKAFDLIPNANERARAKEAAEAQLIEIFAKANEAQMDINKQEAAHNSLFVAGWRPSIGWTCSLALAWTFVLQPFASYALALSRPELPPLPTVQTDMLFELMIGMLGLGGLRTFEKMRGVAREK
jgi:hypothetical protein